jgi:hypothetical protein
MVIINRKLIRLQFLLAKMNIHSIVDCFGFSDSNYAEKRWELKDFIGMKNTFVIFLSNKRQKLQIRDNEPQVTLFWHKS